MHLPPPKQRQTIMKHIETRDRYAVFYPITTRWSDNDLYGHVNNVTYYAYFDTAANRYLIEEGGLDIHTAEIIGVVVESHCNYHSGVAYPQDLEAGLRVDRLGSRSVTYGIGIFEKGAAKASANGHFVHVFVDRATHAPVPIPEPIRRALARITA